LVYFILGSICSTEFYHEGFEETSFTVFIFLDSYYWKLSGKFRGDKFS